MSHQPAIIVPAYNRPAALKGLLDSLLHADYGQQNVALVISIDGGGDKAVIELAQAFIWPYGEKIVAQQQTRLGLKAHILACGALTQKYGSIILLEDDLEVAPGFYQYAVSALNKYAGESNISGISLYSYQIAESNFLPFEPDTRGMDAYLMQFPSSWGQAWTAAQWEGFELWLQTAPTNHQQLPPYIQLWGDQSWKKLFVQYMLHANNFFVYPKASYTTNKGYAGIHFAMRLSLFEVPLYQDAALVLPSFSEMQKYYATFTLSPHIDTSPKVPKSHISVAEYHFRVGQGTIKDSFFSKWGFILQYNIINYFKAFTRKLGH